MERRALRATVHKLQRVGQTEVTYTHTCSTLVYLINQSALKQFLSKLLPGPTEPSRLKKM